MNSILKNQLASLSARPGVYQFFSHTGKLLYVGKAKNLRSRVRSYFHSSNTLSPAKQTMVAEVDHLQVTVVKNETEALLFEGNLIKQQQPPYNIVLKDDKSWLYFWIDYRESYPRVSLERKVGPRGVKSFGPYAQSGTARNSLYLFKKILGLKTCSNPPDKPCFAARLGRCLGHNTGAGSKLRYRKQLKRLEQLLKGDSQTVVADLQTEMSQAAKQKQFERAGKIRDQLQALARLTVKQNAIRVAQENFDVFALERAGANAAIIKLPIRKGALLDSERFLIERSKGLRDAELLTEFLERYYPQVTNKPKKAYCDFVLSPATIAGVTFAVPRRGTKRQLLSLANEAAASHLTSSAAGWQRREYRANAGMTELKTVLKLSTIPKRIEGYDISNNQGNQAVGAMVVLTNGLLDPKSYRKFRIKTIATPNDFAMMRECLKRRFSGEHDWPQPDLIMLDGGLPQLSTISKLFAELKITIPLVALAKREELLYVPGTNKPIHLLENTPGLLILQELRDEAHRFGITFYRARHRKKNITSAWDELPGVGAVLKRKLKNTFGSVTKLGQATEQELAKIAGLKRAKNILAKLN